MKNRKLRYLIKRFKKLSRKAAIEIEIQRRKRESIFEEMIGKYYGNR